MTAIPDSVSFVFVPLIVFDLASSTVQYNIGLTLMRLDRTQAMQWLLVIYTVEYG